MATSSLYLKRNDTRPVLQVTLLNPDRTAHDLTGATAVTLLVHVDGSVVSRAMSIDDIPSGIVSYSWVAADWPSLKLGRHRMEYQKVGPSPAKLTFPNFGYDYLVVLEDLDDA